MTHVSIVATSSIECKIPGMDFKHIRRIVDTSIIAWSGGLALTFFTVIFTCIIFLLLVLVLVVVVVVVGLFLFFVLYVVCTVSYLAFTTKTLYLPAVDMVVAVVESC